MILAYLQIYRELLSLVTFLQVKWNSKELSYLSWPNTYPNLKTTSHIKLKFFLWTKLLENLLFAKYLISVAAPLMSLTIDSASITVTWTLLLSGAWLSVLSYQRITFRPSLSVRPFVQLLRFFYKLLNQLVVLYFT